MKKHILLALYKDLEIHPIVDSRHGWLLTSNELALALNTQIADLLNVKAEYEDQFVENIHYIFSQVRICNYSSKTELFLWSKKGVLRLLYRLKTKEAMEFLDFIEDIQVDCHNNVDDQTSKMFIKIEKIIEEKIENIQKNPNFNASDLNEVLSVMDQLIYKKKKAFGEKENSGALGGIAKLFNIDQDGISDMLSGFIKESLKTPTRSSIIKRREKDSNAKSNDLKETSIKKEDK